ncbi:MAG: hypothetical protein QG617_240, partial [Campylobacterota bacterium]|nr:hypothetical protein [Campylobacterota bacterium]
METNKMTSITALDGANLADLVYSDLIKNSYDAATMATVKEFYTDPAIGLQMALLQVGDRMVVAFRGTTSKQDILTDLDMFAYLQQAGVAHQFNQAGVILSQWIADPRYQLSTSNTTIVGHSLGGSLAQYFGATTGFETLTYNPYGIGNEISGGSNITNYITMHDPVSFLPGSKMIGTTYMLQDESLYDQLGHGISNFTSESSWVAGYSRVNSPRDIDVIDGMGLDSAYELALMAIEGRKFATINDSLDDVIFGGDINNILIGGGGNDWLEGGEGADILEGGAGKDVLIGGYTKDKVDAFT